MVKYIMTNVMKNDFNNLLEIINDIIHKKSNKILLDFNKTYWIQSNNFVILGSLINLSRIYNVEIEFISIQGHVKDILLRNGLLSDLGYNRIIDTKRTTIPYMVFNADNKSKFCSYLETKVLPLIETKVSFSNKFRRELILALEELYQNAIMHGQSDRIITCGQCYPANKYFEYSLLDLGRTIPANVKENLDKIMTDFECIQWATIEGNTTRIKTPGGLGLSLIKEFITLNSGMLEIISGSSIWQFNGSKNSVKESELDYPFPGTIVNLRINFESDSIYILDDEISWEDEVTNIF